MYNLYYLKSNLDQRIYIGITKYPERRHKDHLRYSIRESHYNGNWIRKTIERGGEIEMIIILSNLTKEMAIRLEIKMIDLFRRLKIEITNTADGGLGFNHKGIPHSEEHKRNIEKSQPHKVRIPKDILYDLYINQNLSKKKIGNIYGCGATTIDRRLNEYKISIRKTENYKVSYNLEKDIVLDMYLNKKIPMLKIAKIYNIGISGIRTFLSREGVNIDSKRKGKKSKNYDRIEKVKLYLSKGLKQNEIAKKLNISDGTLSTFIKKYIVDDKYSI